MKILDWLVTKLLQATFAFALVVALVATIPLVLAFGLALAVGLYGQAEEKSP